MDTTRALYRITGRGERRDDSFTSTGPADFVLDSACEDHAKFSTEMNMLLSPSAAFICPLSTRELAKYHKTRVPCLSGKAGKAAEDIDITVYCQTREVYSDESRESWPPVSRDEAYRHLAPVAFVPKASMFDILSFFFDKLQIR